VRPLLFASIVDILVAIVDTELLSQRSMDLILVEQMSFVPECLRSLFDKAITSFRSLVPKSCWLDVHDS
jgi:hypothetical protein